MSKELKWGTIIPLIGGGACYYGVFKHNKNLN
jgi:hypothetical protein